MGFYITQTQNEVSYVRAEFAFDVTDDRTLVGSVHNVFIGKVIGQSGNKTDRYPQTQFNVEVLENIKGNFTGIITVNQEGGYKNIAGKNYLILVEGDKLLVPGKTYLFATRVSNVEGWHTLVPAYGDLIIKDQTDQQNKLERFKKAFAQEIPLEEQLLDRQ